MLIYLCVFPIAVTILLVFSANVQQKRISLFITGFFLSVLIGFRSQEVGIDTSTYYDYYELVLSGYEGTWLEVKLGSIFIYLSLFSAWVGGSASIVTFIYAIFSVFFIFNTILKESTSVSLSIALFFSSLGLFAFMHNVMRQALAISIMLYSVRFIYQRDLIRFTITALVAFLAHASAIFFLPFFFLSRLKVSVIFLFLSWLVSIPFIFIKGVILKILIALSFLIPEQYQHYLQDTALLEKGSSIGLVLFFKQFILLFLLLAYKKDIAHEQKRVIFLLSIYSIIIGNFVLGLGLLGRFNIFLSIFIIIALPLAVYTLIKPQQRFGVCLILIIMSFIIYVQGVFDGAIVPV